MVELKKEQKRLLSQNKLITTQTVDMSSADIETDGKADKKDSFILFIAPPNGENELSYYKDCVVGDSLPGTPLNPSDSSTPTCPTSPIDPWMLPDIEPEDGGTPWSEMYWFERVRLVLVHYCLKFVTLMALLYLFICSLGLLSDSFRLLGGRAAGEVFQDSKLLKNPICGLMIGVLATVLLQSSSTSTSIVVGMVASEILTVHTAIPIVMGANIGTSVTSTLVSVAHSGRRAEFRRAFAGATVHDMFNWLCVICLLPLEVGIGYLYRSSSWIVEAMNLRGSTKKPPKLLKVLTEPLTHLIVRLDKSRIKAIAMGEIEKGQEISLIKRFCGKLPTNGTLDSNSTANMSTSLSTFSLQHCGHLFARTSLGDTTIGLILLFVSLFLLITCLLCIVKLLQSMMRGQMARAIRKTINNDLPGCCACMTGYLAIVLGMVMTILVQSSSVFTSALTPLVGIGVLSLDRMYPLTLGANVGTTFTSLLAALASPPSRLASAVQISLCHLLFNLSGILIFYVIPPLREPPIYLAKLLGNKTAKYRWFAVLYVALMFFVLPATIFGLSLAGQHVFMGVGIPFVSIVVFAIIINILQTKCPNRLPRCLRSWQFLPKWMHSFEPVDRLLCSIGDRMQSICPFCISGWPCCREEGDTVTSHNRSDRSESRRRLVTAGNTPAASIPSHLASRAASPSPRDFSKSKSDTAV